MSNAILFDPLLVGYLARELDQRLRGRACAAAPFFAAERVAALPLEGGEALSLELHPRRGWIRLLPWEADAEELDALCLGVEAPPDERRLVIRLRAGDRFRALERRLEVELHTNQWNALLVSEGEEKILSVLWSRVAGERALRTGATYQPPAGGARFGAGPVDDPEGWARWAERMGGAPPEERRRVLLSEFAYTGTPNADFVLGDAARDPSPDALRAAFQRWAWLRSLPPARPVVLRLGRRRLPYPLPLEGAEWQPVDSLLRGMEEVSESAEAEVAEEPRPELGMIRRRLRAAERRVRRLEEQLDAVGEAARMRFWGDLLLARKRLVPRGADAVKLRDWEGNLVEVTLDPTLTAAENAARWYEEARKLERADERLPDLLEKAWAERARWAAALEAAERGEVPGWVSSAAAAEGGGGGSRADAPTLPYRVYRTSGGLEVRVGRSARANDQLTFHHASPNDVWLHARSVPGSHVILRWREPEGSPPARDLEEAAVLAALYSKARSSTLVPVDWTRRKYVRKPRGAPPGAVIPQRVRTLFVEPDERVDERLRVE